MFSPSCRGCEFESRWWFGRALCGGWVYSVIRKRTNRIWPAQRNSADLFSTALLNRIWRLLLIFFSRCSWNILVKQQRVISRIACWPGVSILIHISSPLSLRIASGNNTNKSESDQEDNDDVNDNDWSYGAEKKGVCPVISLFIGSSWIRIA